MGVATLKASGLIYDDSFTAGPLDDRWEVLPNDSTRYEVIGGLRLKHGADPLFMFFKPLTTEKQFVLDIQNNYNPLTDGDFGGIAVYANDTDYILLEEYFDSTKGTTQAYPWLRLVRDYNTYTAYWSADGVIWNLIDTQEFDRVSPKIGLFLMGATGEVMDLSRVRILKSTMVTVDNLAPGTQVAFKDSTGTVLATRTCRADYTSVRFDMSNLSQPFTGRFTVTNPDSTVYETNETFPIRGGDIYTFEVSLDLYFINGDGVEKLLSKNLEEFLGNVGGVPSTDFKMVLRGVGVFKNVRVDLEQYKGTDHFTRLADIATDVGGSPGIYGQTITFSQISTATSFWIKLFRETDPSKFTPEVFFGIKVYSQFNS